MRRRPRYEAFIATGALAGVVLAVVLTALGRRDPSYSGTGSALYLVLLLAIVGGLLGGLVAVGLERLAESRAHRRGP